MPRDGDGETKAPPLAPAPAPTRGGGEERRYSTCFTRIENRNRKQEQEQPPSSSVWPHISIYVRARTRTARPLSLLDSKPALFPPLSSPFF